ncbi:MAG: undecaprenyl-diphosphate phosphatase, partial [Bdellovibrionia bacterium]
MTTFQAIVYAILRGFTQFLPISWEAHQQLFPFVTHWPAATGAINGALSLGALLALLVYFRHDWASQISCILQVVIFRKRPMTLDERLPLFILIATVPVLIAGPALTEHVVHIEWTPLTIAASLAVFSVILSFSESMSRKNKGMFDWNWLDSLIVGVVQLSTIFVGIGSLGATWIAAMFRNYNREAAAKFAFFALAPLLVVQTVHEFQQIDFHAAQPMMDTSWLSFVVAIIVTMFTGLLVIGAFLKHIERKSIFQYV